MRRQRDRGSFAIHPRFARRLESLYENPAAKAFELKDRTKQTREAKGMEVPVLCDINMEAIV